MTQQSNSPMPPDQSDRPDPTGAAPHGLDIRLGRATCGELDEAERREWWLADGRGGYAAGTVAGTLTRSYHGLLIVPADPPLGRRLLLVKLDATLIDGARNWPLFSNRWGDGTIDPAGHLLIESFWLEGRMPVWHWACEEWLIEQRIGLSPGGQGVWVAYRVLRGRESGLEQGQAQRQAHGPRERMPRLKLSLMIDHRDHHRVRSLHDFEPRLTGDPDHLCCEGPDGQALHLSAFGGTFRVDCRWIEDFQLPYELERGLPDRDDHLNIGIAELSLSATGWCGVSADLRASSMPAPTPAAMPEPEPDLAQAIASFRSRDAALLLRARHYHNRIEPFPPWIEQLILAADSFLIERPVGSAMMDGGVAEPVMGLSVIAGYPWFGDWGRDTMIALPGLTLATGRPEMARGILETFARFLDHGMLPNRFPDAGETPEYNSVDAALWYLDAWRAYLAATDDTAALARVFPALASIIAGYRDGTRFGIALDPVDGLIRAGEPDMALTWMDAKVGDWVVTPRIGKPVEINALWYNGLCVMADFAERLDLDSDPYRLLADRAGRGFARFVRLDGQGLYDVLDGPDGVDARLRPNQLFAVSLTHSPLADRDQAAVVALCARDLLCSYGLRSLAPRDPEYRGRYAGDVHARDAAYHQGTVWTWLLGHYALADYRVRGDIEQAQALLEPLADHLSDAGLGTLSEIFDGDPPHHPRGCPAQAWSVGCVLDAWTRLERIRPGRQA